MITQRIPGHKELFRRVCPVCRTDDITCNFCQLESTDPKNHKHLFTLETRQKLRGHIFKTIIETKIFRCACGQIEVFEKEK